MNSALGRAIVSFPGTLTCSGPVRGGLGTVWGPGTLTLSGRRRMCRSIALPPWSWRQQAEEEMQCWLASWFPPSQHYRKIRDEVNGPAAGYARDDLLLMLAQAIELSLDGDHERGRLTDRSLAACYG